MSMLFFLISVNNGFIAWQDSQHPLGMVRSHNQCCTQQLPLANVEVQLTSQLQVVGIIANEVLGDDPVSNTLISRFDGHGC